MGHGKGPFLFVQQVDGVLPLFAEERGGRLPQVHPAPAEAHAVVLIAGADGDVPLLGQGLSGIDVIDVAQVHLLVGLAVPFEAADVPDDGRGGEAGFLPDFAESAFGRRFARLEGSARDLGA